MARPDQKHDKAKRPARRMAVKARQTSACGHSLRYSLSAASFQAPSCRAAKAGHVPDPAQLQAEGAAGASCQPGNAGSNITPLIVRPLKHAEGYEIIGERRWRAAQLIGMPTLLCCIGNFSDEQAMYLSAVDNIQREGINPIEEAESYNLLLLSGMSHKEVADDIWQVPHPCHELYEAVEPPRGARHARRRALELCTGEAVMQFVFPGLQANSCKGGSTKKMVIEAG